MTSILSTVVLLEGITHLEDLPPGEFIRTVKTLKDKIITEKLDGANLWFGLDENGLFTSREGKSPKKGRFYDVSDYPMVANYNGFRAAHLALEKAKPVIERYLEEGDMVEVEILFGRQPNTVTYGVSDKNFIVILRGVNGTPDDRIKALAKAVDKKTVTVESTIVSSPDGEILQQDDEKVKWEFTQVAPISTKKVDTSGADDLLKQLEKFLGMKNDVLNDKTNGEVAELSLNKVPKEQREEAKAERDKVLAHILNNFKIPIKEMLLGKFVRKIKPFLQDSNLHPSEDIGVEGVVVRDPVTGSQIKIVDKDVFTAINAFNSAVRNSIAGLVRTTDQDAAIEMRGGAFGQAKIRIAEIMGAKELAMSSGVKRFITKFKAETPQATAQALADSLHIESFGSIKTKVSSILKNAISEVNSILDEFKKDSGEFKLKLKTGKEIGITPEIMKRTLTAFAETKKDILDVNARVLRSSTPTELVLALYGKTIESLFDGAEDVKESYTLLKTINEDDAASGASQGATPATNGAVPEVISGTTSSAVIAPLPKMLMKGAKMITRRIRKFKAGSRFPIPKAIKAEGKIPLHKSMTEDWAHTRDLKFATDVDDTAGAKNDIEFNRLRNNVNIGNKVTQMDVNRYLDKAHELNDEVDTVTFGMETDDGKIAKVYVNAAQADEFEKALSVLLGQQDDLEVVINDLAAKYDIVDIEWPEGYVSNTSGDALAATAEQTPEEPVVTKVNDDGEPEIHLGLEGGESDELDSSDQQDVASAESDIESAADTDLNLDADDEEDRGDDEEDRGGDEGGDDNELDVSGSDDTDKPKKKKKKKDKDKDIDLDIDLNASDIEEAACRSGRVISEDSTAAQSSISAFLQSMGVDTSSNTSVAAQLASPKVKANLSKVGANSSLLKTINNASAKLAPAKPNVAPSNAAPQFNGFVAKGDIIAEDAVDQGKWIIAKLGSAGLMLRVTGLSFKIDDQETVKLQHILEKHKTGSVISTEDVRILFKPAEDGAFAVKNVDDESEFPDGIYLSRKQVDEILEMIETY